MPLALHGGLDPVGASAFAGGAGGGAAGRGSEAVRGAGDSRHGAAGRRADRGRGGRDAGARARVCADGDGRDAGELDEKGIGPERALPRISVALGADADQFATMAKLRAMRRLHAMIADACGVEATLHVTATTTARMLSRTDPHTNLLRLTIGAMAAALGGADAIEVLPFDGTGSPFAARMARNIQNLMLEEAHVARLADPGAGSGTIETLTDTIAEAAWRLFQANGAGDPAWLRDGTFARMAATSAARERTIIGVTKHPPSKPVAVARPAPPALPDGESVDGRSLADLVKRAGDGAALAFTAPETEKGAVTPVRAAQAHEADTGTGH